MNSIALVPMAAKPYHAGHDGLVRIAAEENDKVYLFVSASDRIRPGEVPIYGADMIKIWKQFIEKSLPANVKVVYGGSPVGNLYKILEDAESNETDAEFKIYSDKEDIKKFSPRSLAKSAPTLYVDGKINLRGIDRNETVNISGTGMRNLIQSNDAKKFITMLPPTLRKHGQKIFDILANASH